jgi:vacuolar-type H+-ATPase subunit H
MLKRLIQTLFLSLSMLRLQAQDSLVQIPSRYLDQVSSKANQLEQKLDHKSEKALRQMQQLEQKMMKKLEKLDSSKAKEIFGDAEHKYKELEQRLQSGLLSKNYIASLDTISTSLRFLQQNPQLLDNAKEAHRKLKDAMNKVAGIEVQFQKTEEIHKFLKERKDFLKNQLTNLGFARELKKISKNSFYIGQYISEAKEILKDKKKAERKVLQLLAKTKAFQKFFQRNSFLASLFRMPDGDDPSSFGGAAGGLSGLQTRASVTALIQAQISAAGPAGQQQLLLNVAQAQSQLSELKNKINQMGGGSSNDEIPEAFVENRQRKKSFWKKWETGLNIQSNRTNGIMPVSSDIGLSAGFKPNNWLTAGGGLSGRIGWGKSIRHISVSYSGIGIRSFAEIKLKSKGSFYAVAAFEKNYRPEIRNIEQLKDKNGWQSAGLLGLSKIVSLKTKFFKKTKLQLLWDFLSYRQVPMTQPVLFRIDYSLK